MSQRSSFINAIIYCIATVIGIICLPLPIYSFFGAASIVQSIILLVAMDSKIWAYLILSILLLFFILLIVSCVLTYMKKRSPFVFILCIDVIFTVFFCLYNGVFGKVISPFIAYDLVGLAPQILFCVYVIVDSQRPLNKL